MNLSKTELFKKATTLKKQLLQKSDSCVRTVTLKKFEGDAKKAKKQKIPNQTSDYVIFRERFSHPDKYSWGISYEYFSGWPELTKEEINRYCLCHIFFRNFLSCLHRKQKCLDSCFLRLIFLLRDLFLLLIQQSLFKTLLNV